MNFLAHALLAGEDPADQLGGLIGDFVKGPLPAGLPKDIAAGVRLHRLIDVFADTHPAFRLSRARLSPARRRVSGIMVDMFYDHFLAQHWADFHDDPLEVFSARMYALMAEHDHLLPHRLLHQLPHMRDGDWLASYRSARTIGVALDRMALRLRQPAALQGAGVELGLHYADLEADFRVFMRDAIDHARNCQVVLSESVSRQAES